MAWSARSSGAGKRLFENSAAEPWTASAASANYNGKAGNFELKTIFSGFSLLLAVRRRNDWTPGTLPVTDT